MLLAEPPPSQGDVHFTLLGYPVRIHPFFWLTTVFLGDLHRDPIFVVTWVVAVLVCILLHELGHAIVMRYYGYSPSIVLYSFGGLAIPHSGPYGSRRPGPWGNMLISLAGPASGFILTAILILGFHFLAGYPLVRDVQRADLSRGDNLVAFFFSTWRNVAPVWCKVAPMMQQGEARLYIVSRTDILGEFVNDVFYISVFWGLVNLLPIYPLDGGQVAEQVFTLNNPQDAIRPTLILSMIVGGIIAAAFLMKALNATGGMSLQSFFVPMFFGYLTFTNFQMLQSQQDRGGW